MSEIAYAYINGAVNPETLAEFEERITPAKEMDILETSYIEELLEDSVSRHYRNPGLRSDRISRLRPFWTARLL